MSKPPTHPIQGSTQPPAELPPFLQPPSTSHFNLHPHMTESFIKRVMKADDVKQVKEINLGFKKEQGQEIKVMGGLDNFINLHSLNLANNLISHLHFPTSLMHSLRILNLTHNKIEKIDEVCNLGQLEELYLSHNLIATLPSRFSHLPHLRLLHLSHNSIVHIRDLAPLRECMALSVLFLQGNPCAQAPAYRITVISHLPSLTQLDGIAVAASDRTIAPVSATYDKQHFEVEQGETDKLQQRVVQLEREAEHLKRKELRLMRRCQELEQQANVAERKVQDIAQELKNKIEAFTTLEAQFQQVSQAYAYLQVDYSFLKRQQSDTDHPVAAATTTNQQQNAVQNNSAKEEGGVEDISDHDGDESLSHIRTLRSSYQISSALCQELQQQEERIDKLCILLQEKLKEEKGKEEQLAIALKSIGDIDLKDTTSSLVLSSPSIPATTHSPPSPDSLRGDLQEQLAASQELLMRYQLSWQQMRQVLQEEEDKERQWQSFQPADIAQAQQKEQALVELQRALAELRSAEAELQRQVAQLDFDVQNLHQELIEYDSSARASRRPSIIAQQNMMNSNSAAVQLSPRSASPADATAHFSLQMAQHSTATSTTNSGSSNGSVRQQLRAELGELQQTELATHTLLQSCLSTRANLQQQQEQLLQTQSHYEQQIQQAQASYLARTPTLSAEELNLISKPTPVQLSRALVSKLSLLLYGLPASIDDLERQAGSQQMNIATHDREIQRDVLDASLLAMSPIKAVPASPPASSSGAIAIDAVQSMHAENNLDNTKLLATVQALEQQQRQQQQHLSQLLQENDMLRAAMNQQQSSPTITTVDPPQHHISTPPPAHIPSPILSPLALEHQILVDNLARKHEELQQDIQVQTNQLQQLEQQLSDKNAALNDIEQQLVDKRLALSELEQQERQQQLLIQEGQLVQQQYEAVHEQLLHTQQQHQQLHTEHQQLHNEQQQLYSEVQQLRSERESLEKFVAQLKVQEESYLTQLQQHNEQVHRNEQDIVHEQQKLHRIQMEYEQLCEKCQHVQAEYDEMHNIQQQQQQQHAAAESELHTLQSEIAELKQIQQQLSAHVHTLTLSKEKGQVQKAELEKHYEEHRQAIENAQQQQQQLTQQNEQLQQQRQVLEQQIQHALQQLQQLQTQQEDMQKRYEQEERALEQLLTEAQLNQESNVHAVQQLHTQEQQMKEKLASVMQQYESVQQQVKDMQAQQQQQQEQMQLEQQHILSELQQSIHTKENELHTLTNKLEQHEQERIQLESSTVQARQAYDSLASDYQTLLSQYEQHQQQNNTQVEQREQLEQRLEALSEQCNEEKLRLEQLQQQKQQVQHEAQELLLQTQHDMQQASVSMKQEVHTLQQQLDNVYELKKQEEQTLKQIQHQVQEQQAQLSDVVHVTQQQQQAARSQLLALKDELQKLVTVREQIQSELDEMDVRMQQQQQQQIELQSSKAQHHTPNKRNSTTEETSPSSLYQSVQARMHQQQQNQSEQKAPAIYDYEQLVQQLQQAQNRALAAETQCQALLAERKERMSLMTQEEKEEHGRGRSRPASSPSKRISVSPPATTTTTINTTTATPTQAQAPAAARPTQATLQRQRSIKHSRQQSQAAQQREQLLQQQLTTTGTSAVNPPSSPLHGLPGKKRQWPDGQWSTKASPERGVSSGDNTVPQQQLSQAQSQMQLSASSPASVVASTIATPYPQVHSERNSWTGQHELQLLQQRTIAAPPPDTHNLYTSTPMQQHAAALLAATPASVVQEQELGPLPENVQAKLPVDAITIAQQYHERLLHDINRLRVERRGLKQQLHQLQQEYAERARVMDKQLKEYDRKYRARKFTRQVSYPPLSHSVVARLQASCGMPVSPVLSREPSRPPSPQEPLVTVNPEVGADRVNKEVTDNNIPVPSLSDLHTIESALRDVYAEIEAQCAASRERREEEERKIEALQKEYESLRAAMTQQQSDLQQRESNVHERSIALEQQQRLFVALPAEDMSALRDILSKLSSWPWHTRDEQLRTRMDELIQLSTFLMRHVQLAYAQIQQQAVVGDTQNTVHVRVPVVESSAINTEVNSTTGTASHKYVVYPVDTVAFAPALSAAAGTTGAGQANELLLPCSALSTLQQLSASKEQHYQLKCNLMREQLQQVQQKQQELIQHTQEAVEEWKQELTTLKDRIYTQLQGMFTMQGLPSPSASPTTPTSTSSSLSAYTPSRRTDGTAVATPQKDRLSTSNAQLVSHFSTLLEQLFSTMQNNMQRSLTQHVHALEHMAKQQQLNQAHEELRSRVNEMELDLKERDEFILFCYILLFGKVQLQSSQHTSTNTNTAPSSSQPFNQLLGLLPTHLASGAPSTHTSPIKLAIPPALAARLSPAKIAPAHARQQQSNNGTKDLSPIRVFINSAHKNNVGTHSPASTINHSVHTSGLSPPLKLQPYSSAHAAVVGARYRAPDEQTSIAASLNSSYARSPRQVLAGAAADTASNKSSRVSPRSASVPRQEHRKLFEDDSVGKNLHSFISTSVMIQPPLLTFPEHTHKS